MKLESLQEEDIVVFEFFFCFLTANLKADEPHKK